MVAHNTYGDGTCLKELMEPITQAAVKIAGFSTTYGLATFEIGST